jgi:iduronate 2-sulfatase
MTRPRSVLWSLTGLLLLAAEHALLLDAAAAAEGQRLNVLYLVSDDLNCQLGCYGDPTVKSSRIDELAKRGVRFDRAYCQFPLCNPSRASFLTGKRPDQTGVLENSTHFRKRLPDAVTLPQLFQKAGYFVARVGKLYHYGVPSQIGTDGFDDPPSWMQKFNPRGRDKDDEPKIFSLTPGQFGGTPSWLAADGEDHEQTDAIGAEMCVKLLEEHQDKPFFIACGFYRPHTPYVAPKKYFEMYPRETLPLATQQAGDRDDIPEPALTTTRRDMDERLTREARQAYFASISFMDQQVGKVLDALERLNLADKTIIVFHSDHGYHTGEHGGLWQKQSLFEGSARVPLIIAAPGAMAAGKETAAIAELVDVYPTLAELCGLEPPAGLAGKSLTPQLANPAAAGKGFALTQVRRGAGGLGKGKNKGDGKAKTQRGERQTAESATNESGFFHGYALRTDRWRYIEWDGGRRGLELYDHEHDPHEFTNLAMDPQYADVRSELSGQMKKLIQPSP